jgi:hypothetical protein
MVSHVDPDGQSPYLISSFLHKRAQYLSPEEVYKEHDGATVVPSGTSVGHSPEAVHFGIQASPEAP